MLCFSSTMGFLFVVVLFVMVSPQPEMVQGVPVPMFSTFTTCTFIGHGIANIMFGVIQAANATVRTLHVVCVVMRIKKRGEECVCGSTCRNANETSSRKAL
jgi:hypothetical protein